MTSSYSVTALFLESLVTAYRFGRLIREFRALPMATTPGGENNLLSAIFCRILYMTHSKMWLGVKRVTKPNQRSIPDGAYGNFRLLRYRVLRPSPNRTNKCDINYLLYYYWRSLLTAGCHQGKFAGDSRLSPANFRW